MPGNDNMRTAAEVLVDQLQVHGVRHVFCVPGESYLAVLDAFHDRALAVTVCRPEGGTAMMAQASGTPAILRLAIDPEAITPATTLANIRARSLAQNKR